MIVIFVFFIFGCDTTAMWDDFNYTGEITKEDTVYKGIYYENFYIASNGIWTFEIISDDRVDLDVRFLQYTAETDDYKRYTTTESFYTVKVQIKGGINLRIGVYETDESFEENNYKAKFTIKGRLN